MDSEHSEKFMDQRNICSGDEITMATMGFPLSTVARGESFIILNIPKGRGRTQLIRLGIMRGELIKCVERLPGGTVVLEKNRQEIAIGSALAESIMVGYGVSG